MGTIVSSSQDAPNIEFTLADGRSLSFDRSIVRTVVEGAGDPMLLVSGRDAAGPWIAVVGHQDGTPAGCHTLNRQGYDFGTTIAISGVRWLKAPALAATGVAPGQPYPSDARFCLDDFGRIDKVLTD